MKAGGSAGLNEAAEDELLDLLVLVGEALDNLGNSVDVLGHLGGGDEETSLGGSGSSLLLAVGLLVLGDEGEGSLEFLFGVLFSGSEADGAGSAGSVVEAGEGEGVVGPLVASELDKLSIVSLGESPNNAVGGLHFYRKSMSQLV
jgi:hypothetical protein